MGRLSRVRHMGVSPKNFDYAYEPDSHLIDTVTGPEHTVTNSYETHRNHLLQVNSHNGTETMSNYRYRYNEIGQRDAVAYSGAAYGAVGETESWFYEYNDNGEVTELEHANEAFDVGPMQVPPALNYDYVFDAIGNRITANTFSATTDSWAYFQEASGSAPGGNNDNQYGKISAPGGIEIRVHDADGNLTDDGKNLYAWDAENRLVSTTRKSDSKLLAEYRYDYMGRRVWKKTTGDAPQGAQERIFVYHGWNLIAEYEATSLGKVDATADPVRTYTWGSDLSGSLQGAGGVGGLLVIEEHSGSHDGLHYPTYDGNGNVVAILSDTGGSKEAAYLYDAFGGEAKRPASTTVFAEPSGSYRLENPFRFSTKYHDEETEWYYYGYRYYSPATGRWPSRDPIEEEGGSNLYGFVGNDGVNGWDYLGMKRPCLQDFIRAYPSYSGYQPNHPNKPSLIPDENKKPGLTAKDVYRLVGGWIQTGAENGDRSIAGSCALRVSLALNKCGKEHKVSGKGTTGVPEGKEPDDRQVISAEKMVDYLGRKWGEPDYTFSKDRDGSVMIAELMSIARCNPCFGLVFASKGHVGVVTGSGFNNHFDTIPTDGSGDTVRAWILPCCDEDELQIE